MIYSLFVINSKNEIPKEIKEFAPDKGKNPILFSQISFGQFNSAVKEEYPFSSFMYKRKRVYFTKKVYTHDYHIIDLYKHVEAANYIDTYILINHKPEVDEYSLFVENLLEYFNFTKISYDNDHVLYYKKHSKTGESIFNDFESFQRFFEIQWIDIGIINPKELIDYLEMEISNQQSITFEQTLYDFGIILILASEEPKGINMIKVARMFNITTSSPELAERLNMVAYHFIEKYDLDNGSMALNWAIDLDPSNKESKAGLVLIESIEEFLDDERKKYPK